MFFSLTQILLWLNIYKYFVLFPIAVLEGPIISVIAGFLCSIGQMNFAITLVILICGDMVGDAFYYALGYFGRTKFLDRWGHHLKLDQARLGTLDKHFTDKSWQTLLLGKITQVAGGGILVAAGAAKMPFGKFMAFNAMATVPKSLALLLIGFYFGKAYITIEKYFNYGSYFLAGLVVLMIIIYFLYKLYKKYHS